MTQLHCTVCCLAFTVLDDYCKQPLSYVSSVDSLQVDIPDHVPPSLTVVEETVSMHDIIECHRVSLSVIECHQVM